MVGVNYNQRRPEAVLSLRFVDELREWNRDDGMLVLAAGVRFSDIEETEIAMLAPALAQPARTIGSPQFRNTETIGGNTATAPPAGNTLPFLSALDAMVNLNGVHWARSVPISEFVAGVKKTRLARDELIMSISNPVADGPQEFLKVGKRKAMVIAVANLAFVCNPERRHVACAFGAVGPTVTRCTDAENFIRERIDWRRRRVRDRVDLIRFGEMCSRQRCRSMSQIDIEIPPPRGLRRGPTGRRASILRAGLLTIEQSYECPPCGPELNPVETLCSVLKHRYFPNRVFENAEHVRETVEGVWSGFTRMTGKILQITAREWAVL